jgi:hypothetical protein
MDEMIGRAGQPSRERRSRAAHGRDARASCSAAIPLVISAFALAETDFTEIIPKVAAPTLVIWGTEDQIASMRTGQVLAARLQDARLVTLSSDHTPMRAQPQRCPGADARAPERRRDRCDVARTSDSADRDERGERAVRRGEQRGVRRRRVRRGRDPRLPARRDRHTRASGSLDVSDSTVFLTNSIVEGTDVAVRLVNTNFTGTAVDINRRGAVSAENSNLDLAGVRLAGRTAAVVASQPSRHHLSRCRAWRARTPTTLPCTTW